MARSHFHEDWRGLIPTFPITWLRGLLSCGPAARERAVRDAPREVRRIRSKQTL
ncbi:MAG: hypothetical protein KDJ72_00480 [Methyloceanibacter sp.]|uniref:hypothetical protein n=1 Tax=Methyloceanibacter sp. TaxID=1965321 RepID=UPI001E0EDA13|nr:hypothetical protein [Methyloceanibacter sp.]MCB1441471.1 hypothetical protein [Methyloceanibacter sp.]